MWVDQWGVARVQTPPRVGPKKLISHPSQSLIWISLCKAWISHSTGITIPNISPILELIPRLIQLISQSEPGYKISVCFPKVWTGSLVNSIALRVLPQLPTVSKQCCQEGSGRGGWVLSTMIAQQTSRSMSTGCLVWSSRRGNECSALTAVGHRSWILRRMSAKGGRAVCVGRC